MTSPSLVYQDAMNGIAILYDALSNAENELDKIKNAWIKYNECTPSKDGYAWDMFEEPEREVMYVWRDGDFENRLRFLAKFEVIQRLDVIELEEDDDPDDF